MVTTKRDPLQNPQAAEKLPSAPEAPVLPLQGSGMTTTNRATTKAHKIAKALAMHDCGASLREIAKETGVNHNSVNNILNHKHPYWEKILDTRSFQKWREYHRGVIQVAQIQLAEDVLRQAEAALPEANFKDAMFGFGILRDKDRLDAGEPTEIKEEITRHTIENLDELGEKLAQALLKRKAQRALTEPTDEKSK